MKTQQTQGHAKPTKKKIHAPQPTAPAAPNKTPQVLTRPNHEQPSSPAERAENEGMKAPAAKVEGEGSYEATHRYDDGVARSVARGETTRLAQDAARALDGPEGRRASPGGSGRKKGTLVPGEVSA
jgi:hypothetical protein